MTVREPDRRRGFSLIELVIVVLIMGIVAAIAIPRMNKSSDHADLSAAKANYALLNRALGMYAAEHHGAYPTVANVKNALTKYSNVAGSAFDTAPDPANGVIYGPYILKIPVLTYGPHKGDSKIAGANSNGVGWIYREAGKHIVPNLRNDQDELPDDIVEAFGWTRERFDDGLPVDLPIGP